MEQINIEGLGAVQETLIIPLAMRALDLKSKKPILGDKYAAELYERVAYDKEKFAPKKTPSYYGCLQRARYIDEELLRYARQLHASGTPFVTVNAGCGLDTRGERIAERTYGAVHFDMDFPNVIQLRRTLLSEQATLIEGNLLEEAWIEALKAKITPDTHVLIAIEGVFAYLSREEIQRALRLIYTAFAGRCIVVFDALSSFWAKRSRQHDTLRHMEASFTGGIDSEEDILGLLPEAHFERKIPIVDLMAQVWWVAHLMKLTSKMRHNVQIFTFTL